MTLASVKKHDNMAFKDVSGKQRLLTSALRMWHPRNMTIIHTAGKSFSSNRLD